MYFIPYLLQWHLVDRIYDVVTYYALKVWFDIARDAASILYRLWMGG